MRQFPALDTRFGLLLLVILLLCSCVSKPRVINLDAPFNGFDPRVISDDSNSQIERLIFNALTRIDAEGCPIPDLAESFAVTPDQTTHTFRLRKGVRFHNDRRLTSLDVKYTFETMFAMEVEERKRILLTGLQLRIEVPDAHTVIFRCGHQCANLPSEVSAIGIIPEGSSSLLATNPNGTGPFRFERRINDIEFSLARYDGYFGQHPTEDRLLVRIGSSGRN